MNYGPYAYTKVNIYTFTFKFIRYTMMHLPILLLPDYLFQSTCLPAVNSQDAATDDDGNTPPHTVRRCSLNR